MKPDLLLRSSFIHILLIVVSILLLYYQVLDNEYTKLDDVIMIENEWDNLHQTENLTEAFKDDIFKEPKGAYYRPVQTLTYMLDVWLFDPSKDNPTPFFVSSILLFILNSILLYYFLLDFKINPIYAALSVLFLNIHPTIVPAVAWIPGKIELYLFLFSIICLWSSKYYFATRKWYWLLPYSICLTLALFNKESAVAIPIMCFFLYLFLANDEMEMFSFNYWKSKLIQFFQQEKAYWILTGILTLGFIAIRAMVLHDTEHGIKYLIAQSFFLPVDYIILLASVVFPFNLPVFITPDWQSLIVPSILLMVLAYLFSDRIKSSKDFYFGLAWFVIFILPASMTEKINFHRLYIPLVGIVFVIRSIHWPSYVLKPLHQFGILSLVAAWFLFQNLQFQQAFEERYSFWQNAYDHDPDDKFICNGMAYIYHIDQKYDSAMYFYNKALSIDSTSANTRMGIALIHHQKRNDDLVDQLMIDELTYTKDTGFVYANYAEIFLERKDTLNSIHWFEKAYAFTNNLQHQNKANQLKK